MTTYPTALRRACERARDAPVGSAEMGDAYRAMQAMLPATRVLALLSVVEAAQKFVPAYDLCEPYIVGQFARNPDAYRGPTFGVQLDALRSALSAIDASEG